MRCFSTVAAFTEVVGPMGVLRRAGPVEEEGAAYTAVSALSDRSGERVGDLWVPGRIDPETRLAIFVLPDLDNIFKQF